MPGPMRMLLDRISNRLVPALLTAAGVALLAAGLLTYTDPVAAIDPSPSPAPTSTATPSPPPSAVPDASASTEPSPSPSGERAVATRVVIAGMRIDLPVIEGPATYPPCDVAMYIKEMAQPGEPGATYIYAHARTGMFLPLLTESRRNDGARMLGMLVQVYTSDDRLHLYEVVEVRPVVPFESALTEPLAATTDQLWLQTSIGPKGTPEKMQVIAMPLSTSPADPAAAHPQPKPVACG
jgi:hypothetical protein